MDDARLLLCTRCQRQVDAPESYPIPCDKSDRLAWNKLQSIDLYAKDLLSMDCSLCVSAANPLRELLAQDDQYISDGQQNVHRRVGRSQDHEAGERDLELMLVHDGHRHQCGG